MSVEEPLPIAAGGGLPPSKDKSFGRDAIELHRRQRAEHDARRQLAAALVPKTPSRDEKKIAEDLETCETKLTELEQKIADLTRAKKDADERANVIYDASQETVADLTAQIKNLEAQIPTTASDDAKESMQRRINELSKLLQEEQVKASNSEKNLTACNERETVLKDDLKQCTANEVKLKEQLQLKDARIQELTRNNASNQNDKNQEITTLEEAKKTLEASLVAERGKIAQFENELVQLRSQLNGGGSGGGGGGGGSDGGDEYTITVKNKKIEDGEYGFEYSDGSWRVLFGPDDESKEAMVFEMSQQKTRNKLREDAQYVVGSKNGITVTMKRQTQLPRQRMFSIDADDNAKTEFERVNELIGAEVLDKLDNLDVWQDFANGTREGTVKKYEAMVDRGLVGAKGQVMGGFFVVDEAEMEKKGGVTKYAEMAAGTTIRLLLAMLSCTVGKASVDGKDSGLAASVDSIKVRYRGVKGMTEDIVSRLDNAMGLVQTAVGDADFKNEKLLDHTATIDDAIDALGLGKGENVEKRKALAYLRAFNAITSFFMTAQDTNIDGTRAFDMLTTAFDIVLQFQAVRRMVQLEAIKRTLDADKANDIDSTAHLDELAKKTALIGSGSAHVRGGKCGGGLSRSFVQRMFELYVK